MEEGYRREYQVDGKVRRAWLVVPGSKNRGMGPRAIECVWPLEARRSTERVLSRASTKEYGPLDTLILAS